MLIKIILIFILLILSALTSGSEVAFFALEKSMLSDDKGGGLIEKIQKLLEQPQRLLATILISNNFINIAIVILFASIDNPYLSSINNVVLETFIEVGVIGILILFFGDILPKIYANRNLKSIPDFVKVGKSNFFQKRFVWLSSFPQNINWQ